MDRNSYRGYRIGRRPMIAVMAKSGLRVSEMCQLRWRDVDVHHQRLVIAEAKTDAGNREVDLSLDVMEELMAWRASRPATADGFVFATDSGRPRDKENIRGASSARRSSRTNELRAKRDYRRCPGQPARVAAHVHQPHDRGGAPLPYVMSQVGHVDSRTTLEMYAQVQKRLSRKQVHGRSTTSWPRREATEVPTDGRDKMSRSVPDELRDAETASAEALKHPVVHAMVHELDGSRG